MHKGYWDLELVKDYIERNKGAEWMQIQLWNVLENELRFDGEDQDVKELNR